MLAATLRLWVLALGKAILHPRDVADLLPSGVLAGGGEAYRSRFPFSRRRLSQHGCPLLHFTRAMARSTATSFLFAVLSRSLLASQPARRATLFADAAPFGERFRMGSWAGLGFIDTRYSPDGFLICSRRSYLLHTLLCA